MERSAPVAAHAHVRRVCHELPAPATELLALAGYTEAEVANPIQSGAVGDLQEE